MQHHILTQYAFTTVTMMYREAFAYGYDARAPSTPLSGSTLCPPGPACRSVVPKIRTVNLLDLAEPQDMAGISEPPMDAIYRFLRCEVPVAVCIVKCRLLVMFYFCFLFSVLCEY